MKRAAVAMGVFAGLILLLALNAPPWLAISGSVMALAGVGAGGFMRWAWRARIVQWGKMPTPDKCENCQGWGVLKLDGSPFQQDPRTLAHVLWARGNRRTCRLCLGHGFYARRLPNRTPGPVVTLQPADPPPDPLFPDGPETIEPTQVFPPGKRERPR